MGKTQKRMDKPKKRMSKTQKIMGKTQKRMGKTQKRMGKRGGDSPELSDEEKQVQKYLRNPWNFRKNYKVSFRKTDRDHVVYPVEKVRTMEPTEIEVLKPEYVGYFYFNDPNLTSDQRKALAKVLVKKIEQDKEGTHMERSGIWDDFRWTNPFSGLGDDGKAKPFYDGKHLTHKQIERLPYKYVAEDLDPGLYGKYQDSWLNFERIPKNATAFSEALKRKERESTAAAPAAG